MFGDGSLLMEMKGAVKPRARFYTTIVGSHREPDRSLSKLVCNLRRKAYLDDRCGCGCGCRPRCADVLMDGLGSAAQDKWGGDRMCGARPDLLPKKAADPVEMSQE
jgi:hypothetical protein